VAAFVAPSAFIAARHSDFGLPASKLHHIPNFTCPTRRLPRPSAGSGFLYCGRLSEEKGVPVLVEAARLAPEIEVVLAGSGDLREALGPRPPANVRFLGQVPRERVPALMADARALVVPSIWYENCSLSVLEAFAAGAPVIGSAIGGLFEQIDSGDNGFLVPPGDAHALAEAMRSLHVRPRLALRMGAAAKAKADRVYSPQAHYDSLMPLYASLVAPSGQAIEGWTPTTGHPDRQKTNFSTCYRCTQWQSRMTFWPARCESFATRKSTTFTESPRCSTRSRRPVV